MAADAGRVVWYVGVYYPGRGRVVANGVDGYVLSPFELHVVASQLVGMPVTFEHYGIAAACMTLEAAQRYAAADVTEALRKTAATNSLCEPIGAVCDAWQAWNGDWLCAFSVDSVLYPRLCTMIECHAIRGLSLSHLQGPVPQALEVSLCSEPARPCSLLCAGPLASPCQVEKYKAGTLLSPMHIAMSSKPPAPPTEAAPSPMTEALASMPEETRALISAAFNDMSAKLETTRQRNDELTSQYAAFEKAAKVDKSLLAAQLDTFLSQLDPATKERFSLDNAACRSGVVDSEDPNMIRRNVDRLLMCCNSVMMERRRDEARVAREPSGKRAADPAEVADAGASHGNASQDEERFDPATTVTPAESLRAALSQF